MRFNDRELKELSETTPAIQGTMQYMKPQSGDWYEWYQQSPFKERIFKLVNNILFYYRINEPNDPLGCIVMENMEVAYENPDPAAFTFSLSGYDGKHIFACRCDDDLNRWVAALKVASYGYWKNRKTILEAKLRMIQGNAPIKPCTESRRAEPVHQVQKLTKSTFYGVTPQANSHVLTDNTHLPTNTVPIDNLIEF